MIIPAAERPRLASYEYMADEPGNTLAFDPARSPVAGLPRLAREVCAVSSARAGAAVIRTEYDPLRGLFEPGLEPDFARLSWSGGVVEAGRRCLGAMAPDRCRSELAGAGANRENWRLLVRRGDRIEGAGTDAELSHLLGPVRTLGHAALRAALSGHVILCGASTAEPSGQDWLVTAYTHAPADTCAVKNPAKAHLLRVRANGAAERVRSFPFPALVDACT